MELYNDLAEQLVLGNLLRDNNSFDKISDILYPTYFAHSIHQKIFTHIKERIEAGKSVKYHNFDFLHDDTDLIDVGGKAYISGLSANSIDYLAFIDNANIIRDMALKRKLVDIANDALLETKTKKEVPKILEDLERSLFLLGDKKSSEDIKSAKVGMEEAVQWMEEIHSGRIKPLRTGLRDLDFTIKGLFPGRLYIIAGRPGMGKTVLALNIAEYASKFEKVLYFSLEMSRQELSMRLGARYTGISVEDQSDGVDPTKRGALRDSVKHENLLVDERSGLTIAQISLVARRLHRQGKLGLIVIDYLGLISGDTRLGIVNKVSEITAECKRLAKELSIPVVLLSQLNRGVEGRDDKRPTLADLRDSGSIEQDADVVMLLYRDEYYAQMDETKPKFAGKRNEEKKLTLDEVRGKAEIIIAKNRQGRAKTVEVMFNGEKQFFYDGVKY